MGFIYIGTYAKSGGKGIYFARFDEVGGRVADLRLAALAVNPSFLAVHPSRRFLFAASELDCYNLTKSGSISAFAIDWESGELMPLNEVSSHGAWPCHLAADASGQNILATNYGGGSVVVLPVKQNGFVGEISTIIQHAGSSVHPTRQQKPHPHSVALSPDNRFALVPDLGLDQVLVYRFDAARGLMGANQPPFATGGAGAGPRHCGFHPNGRLVYVINELRSTVTAFAYGAAGGVLKELLTLPPLPEDFHGDSTTAEVQGHPSGRFLYGSNRGHNSIAVFDIHPQTGVLAPLGHVPTQGKKPRHFGIDPSGKFLLAANQDSNSVVIFRIHLETGGLTPTGQKLEVAAPACVKFVPATSPHRRTTDK